MERSATPGQSLARFYTGSSGMRHVSSAQSSPTACRAS